MVMQEGLSTGETSFGTLDLHFARPAVIYTTPGGYHYDVPIQYLSQASLTDMLVKILRDAGFHPEPDRTHIGDRTPFTINIDVAGQYAEVLYQITEVLNAFAGSLPGVKTQPRVWPHGFDLSFLWFATDQTNEQTAPHMNFGFAPYSEDVTEPYFYSYAWNGQTQKDILLPKHTTYLEGTKTTMLPYSVVQQHDHPQDYLKAHFVEIYEHTKRLL
jgi:hypothetical protein